MQEDKQSYSEVAGSAYQQAPLLTLEKIFSGKLNSSADPRASKGILYVSGLVPDVHRCDSCVDKCSLSSRLNRTLTGLSFQRKKILNQEAPSALKEVVGVPEFHVLMLSVVVPGGR